MKSAQACDNQLCMWWTKNKTDEESSKPRCPTCVTHPVLVQSGYSREKSLRCPVCKVYFDDKGNKYDPDSKSRKGNKNPSIKEEVEQEQQELWESLWGT